VQILVRLDIPGPISTLDRASAADLLEQIAADIRENTYTRAAWAEGEAKLSYSLMDDGEDKDWLPPLK